MKIQLIRSVQAVSEKIFFFLPLLKFINAYRRLKATIYSSIIFKEFKSCGTNLTVFLPAYILGHQNIVIGDYFTSFKGLRLEAYSSHQDSTFTPSIVIGNNVSINMDCHIACVNKISIGNNVLIASKVFITDHFHGNTSIESIILPPSKRIVESRGPVIIEDNVWIGEGVAIMPDVKIGRNSIIGANAVVTKSFPANSVIAGNPAKLIKTII